MTDDLHRAADEHLILDKMVERAALLASLLSKPPLGTTSTPVASDEPDLVE